MNPGINPKRPGTPKTEIPGSPRRRPEDSGHIDAEDCSTRAFVWPPSTTATSIRLSHRIRQWHPGSLPKPGRRSGAGRLGSIAAWGLGHERVEDYFETDKKY